MISFITVSWAITAEKKQKKTCVDHLPNAKPWFWHIYLVVLSTE